MSASDPQGDRVLSLFDQQVTKQPCAIAALFQSRAITYLELSALTHSLAHRLRGLGVGPDSIVGIALERSIEMVVGVLSVLRAGGAYLPLDPTHPGERLRFMLDDSQAAVVVTEEKFLQLPPIAERSTLLVESNCSTERLEHRADDRGEIAKLVTHTDSKNLAYVIYTSGSTGRPKGVMIQRQSFDNQIEWMSERYPLRAGDRVLQLAALTFDFSVVELFWPLVAGATIVLPVQGGEKDPEYLAALLLSLQVTDVHFVPSMLDLFLAHPVLPALPSLRRLFSGGEVLTPKLVRRCRVAFPGVEIHNQYGPTETTVNATHWECVGEENPVPIGSAVGATSVHVLDELLQPVAENEVGEIFIGGVQVARGYFGKPALSAERFLPDPFSAVPGQRMFRTGDLARFSSNGTLQFTGRVDHQVKIRGFRVELGEIEAVLAQAPQVLQAVVVFRRHRTERHGQLIAFLVARNRIALNLADLRQHLARYLPNYMIPLSFIQLDALPVGLSGKIDRMTLSLATTSVDAGSSSGSSGTVERVLCLIVADLVGTPSIDPAITLLEQGLDSITIVQFAVRVRELFQVSIPVRFLRRPIIQEIEHFIVGRVQQEQLSVVVSSAERALGMSETECRAMLAKMDPLQDKELEALSGDNVWARQLTLFRFLRTAGLADAHKLE